MCLIGRAYRICVNPLIDGLLLHFLNPKLGKLGKLKLGNLNGRLTGVGIDAGRYDGAYVVLGLILVLQQQ